MQFDVTWDDIYNGSRHGSWDNALALAIARRVQFRSVCVMKGPMVALSGDAKVSPSSMDVTTKYGLLWAGAQVLLPHRCQVFMNAIALGPGTEYMMVVSEDGKTKTRTAWDEIVQPFSFDLKLFYVAPPEPLQSYSAKATGERDEIAEGLPEFYSAVSI